MPVDQDQATTIVKKNIPGAKIQATIFYKDSFLFQVFTDDPYEGEMDPFYSVNRETGAFTDFSILAIENSKQILNLFQEAKGGP
jgi:hypothetical protein